MPQALRVILEKALSEDASQENLDRYLPSIREIIVNLLRQLKQKQSLIRSSSRSASVSSKSTTSSSQPPPPHHHQGGPQPPPPPPHHQQPPPPHGKSSPSIPSSHSKQNMRSESIKSQGSSDNVSRQPSDGSVAAHYKTSVGSSDSDRSGEHYDRHHPVSAQRRPSHENSDRSRSPSKSQSQRYPHHPPQPPPGQHIPRKNSSGSNPLAALQRGEALERRASRRFSAYQFAKLTNGTQGAREAVPDLPPLPGTPPSNRSSYLPTKAPQSSSPADFTSSNLSAEQSGDTTLTATLPPPPEKWSSGNEVSQDTIQSGPINIFLQIGRKVKKAVVERSDITIPALRLLFIDKFAYSPGADTFPDIYIQDPHSGIRYELDEKSLDDLRTGSLLSLNIEAMDEVKKHIDEGLGGILKSINDLSAKIEQNTSSIQKVSDPQASPDTTTTTVATSTETSADNGSREIEKNTGDRLSRISMKQIDSLRHEMSIIRQIGGTALNGFRDQAADIMKKIQVLQASVNLPAPGGTSRSYMEACHKKLSGDTDNLLTNVDDLQDIIEALRKDVAQRGVRPPIRQLESVSKELAQSKSDLEKMEKYINTERPSWKKIWERELDTICEEQQFFKLQEELVADLQDDLQKAAETFSLVEQCSQEQTKSMKKNQTVVVPAPVDGIVHAKDAVLSEVCALQPNHEQRVEAIERAEKLRKKELEMRGLGDEFKEELGEFVEENKLKKSGGVEETERRRKIREQKMLEEQRKNDAEIQAAKAAEREKKREEREKEREKKKNEKKKDKEGKESKEKKKKKDKSKKGGDKEELAEPLADVPKEKEDTEKSKPEDANPSSSDNFLSVDENDNEAEDKSKDSAATFDQEMVTSSPTADNEDKPDPIEKDTTTIVETDHSSDTKIPDVPSDQQKSPEPETKHTDTVNPEDTNNLL